MNLFLHTSPFWLRAIYPKFLWRMSANAKVIYLTFDDGPIPEVTEFVLDTLESHHAKATFFCIGDNVRKYPEIFEKIISEGHSVGNHTHNHLNGWNTSDEMYLLNIAQCAECLGIETNLFRPPYGRIRKAQADKILPVKMIVMWDVLTGDFSPNISPENCLKKTIKYMRPGSIVVFHDSLKARRNLEYTLPRALSHFGGLGYEFHSLPMHDNVL